MSNAHTSDYRTWAAHLIAGLIAWEEEHFPVPRDGSAGMLVARVVERLGQAGFELGRLGGDFEELDHEELSVVDLCEPTALQVSSYFAQAAAFAVTASAHVRTMWASIPAIQIKDNLLGDLDGKVEGWIDDNYDFYLGVAPDFWLKTTLAMSVGAARAVCALEGAQTPLFDEAQPARADDEPVPVIEALADSLAELAWMAAVAAQWFGYEDE